MYTTFNNLPEDVLYTILLNADIDEINNLCYIKPFNKLCSEQFWINLFQNDHLPIIEHQHTIPDWVKEYKKIYSIIYKVNFLFEQIKVKKLTNLYIDSIYDKSIENLYLPKLIAPKNFYSSLIIKILNDDYIIGFNSYPSKTASYTKDEFKNFVINMLYYYPDLHVKGTIDIII